MGNKKTKQRALKTKDEGSRKKNRNPRNERVSVVDNRDVCNWGLAIRKSLLTSGNGVLQMVC